MRGNEAVEFKLELEEILQDDSFLTSQIMNPLNGKFDLIPSRVIFGKLDKV